MRLSVSLQKSRCFAAVGPVRVAPITVLIGENSTGKTSFLAAIRELVEAFNRSAEALFDREPFLPGSFEQIAHYRGGRSGRARGSRQRDLLARRIAGRAPLAMRQGKASVRATFETTEAAHLAYERQAFSLLSGSRDKTEGVTAFLEKRDPVWSGR